MKLLRPLFSLVAVLICLASPCATSAGSTNRWIGASGDWNTPTNWSTGSLPGTTDDVIIDAPGVDITITHSSGIDTVKSLQSQEAFVLSGGSLTVSNTLQLGANFALTGGTLRGATVVTTNGARLDAYTTGQAGVLDAVTINGELGLNNYGAQVTIVNGLTLNGTMWVGPTAPYAAGIVTFAGSQTLSGNGTVVFGGHALNELLLSGNGTTLTLGPNIIVRGGSGRVLNATYNSQSVFLINQGTISSEGGTLSIYVQGLTNLGTLRVTSAMLNIQGLQGNLGSAAVSGGGTLDLDGTYVNDQDRVVADSTLTLRGSWTNAASITLSNATLNLTNGTWANAGAITGTNMTLNLGGSATQVGAITVPGSVVNVVGSFTSTQIQSIGYSSNAVRVGYGGVVDNRGQLLLLDAGTGSWVLTGGTIWGGTVVTTNDVPLIVGQNVNNGNRLDGVTLNGNLDMTGYGVSATVVNGLVLNGTAYLGSASYASSLSFSGSQTLAGNGTVIFGPRYYNLLCLADPGTTLTIGPGITVRGYYGIIGGRCNVGTGWSVVNQGTIWTEGYTMIIDSQNFTNQGTLRASGGTLQINGLQGNVGNASVSNGGTLDLDGTYVNDQDRVVADSTLTLRGSWTNAASITLSNATLNLSGTFTTPGLGTINGSLSTVNLTGTLLNTNTSLALNAASGSWAIAGGTILGGTVSTADGTKLTFTSSGGTLDGVVVNGDLDFPGGSDVRVSVLSGLTLNGTATIGPSGSFWARMEFFGSQTLDGTGTVVFGDGYGPSLRVMNNDTTLTIGPGVTVRRGSNQGEPAYLGFLPPKGGNNTRVSVVNQGTILADTSDRIIRIRGQGFTNLGNIFIKAGAVLDTIGSIAVDGSNQVSIQEAGILQITGDVFGDSQATPLFAPRGTLVLDGSGNAVFPQFLEVMSRDLGANAAGFNGPFAYGTLALANNTYVRLVDQSDNSPGTEAEALYVNALIVPSGSTLDQNGVRLYTRATQISGNVTNNFTLFQIPDQGPIAFSTPTSGAIETPGQLDEWTFFARAGHTIAVLVDTGSGSVLAPQLGYADVSLLDPFANLVTRGSNTVARQTVALTDVLLPADGTYSIRIHAPANHLSSTGNYQITLWESTPNVAPLVLDQTMNGRIQTPYSVDRWTFTAIAGQQVQFNLINASASGVAFTLRGPNGWIGFSNLISDSDLVSLPASGEYDLTAFGIDGAFDIAYAFKLTETVPTDLVLGTAFTGQFLGSGQAQLFRITLDGNQPVQILLQNAATNNRVELYAGFALPPTRGTFTFADNQGPGSSRQILAGNTYPGAYYVLVYGDSIGTPGPYTLTVQTADFFLTQLSPAQSGNGSTAVVEIDGVGFQSTAQVRLEGNGITLPASSLTWVSSTRMVANFDLSMVASNSYQIVVTQGATSASLPFQVSGGRGAKFQANLITPSGISFNTVQTLYVEFANVGDQPMVAPLLAVRGEAPGFGLPQFSLNSDEVSRDFWAASQPTVSAGLVSFFATGRIPGILLPGESGRVPVHFVGIRPGIVEGEVLPHDATIIGWRLEPGPPPAPVPSFIFKLLQYLPPSVAGIGEGKTQPDKPLSWESLRTNVPPNLQPAAWDAIWMNYTNAAGGSVYSFFGMLQQNVDYLSRLGLLRNSITKVDDLLAFELAQADGLHILRTLATATDGYAPTPGLRLSFDRTFPNTISGRYQLGRLGRGWTHNWEERLVRNAFGDVTIIGQSASQRLFKPDLRGGYKAGLDDYGTLVSLPNYVFQLREKGGLVKQFRDDGKLEFVADPNGNKISCTYSSTGLKLTSLTHSSGQRLDFGYNAQGRIATITDTVGRTTQFCYDASGEHLAIAEYYDGRILRYQYSTGNGAQSEHALTEVQFPDQSHQYFAYDPQGRLQTKSRDGGAELVTYAYDNAGTVYATDAFNNTAQFLFDNRGLLARMVNPKGELVRLDHDVRFNITGVTDPAGRSFQYNYDAKGNVTGIVDALGHQTQFAYEPQFQRRSQLIDANGNPTRYHHDDRGNLTGITDASGRTENWGYDAIGTPNTWTNRRLNAIQYQFNPTNGLLLAKVYPDGSRADYEYDPRGNLTAASNYTGRITLDYYPANDRLQRITYPGGRWLEYTYDAAGHRLTMTDQLAYQLRYDYDAVGRLRSITNSENIRLVLYQYDMAGRLALKTLGNNVYTTYTYDVANRLEKLTNALPDGSMLSLFNYTYDARARRTAMATHYGTWTYRYDDLGQLTNAVLVSTDSHVPNQDLTYIYDTVGNRGRTVENGATTDYVLDNLSQYVRVGRAIRSFDLDGSLTGETTQQETNAFVYDFENRLIGVTLPSNSWQYAYDALGNRAERTRNGASTQYTVDPIGQGNAVGEYDGANVLVRYVYGFGLVSGTSISGTTKYFAYDGIGNTHDTVFGDGTLSSAYAYDPFGVVIQSSSVEFNAFRFGGEQGLTDENNGLHFARARFYEARNGCFVGEDPLRWRQPGSPYGYAMNNPVSFVDLSGLAAFPPGPAFDKGDGTWVLPAPSGPSEGWDGGAGTFGGHGASGSWHETPKPISAEDLLEQGVEIGAVHYLVPVVGEALLPLEIGYDVYKDLIQDTVVQTFWGDLAFDVFDWWNQLDWDEAEAETLVPIFGHDPNQKLVLTGLGGRGFIQAGSLIPYRIDFENDTNATAPAQGVFLTDRLTNTLDWQTFELAEIGFGDERIMLPPQTQHFETNLPVAFNGASFVVQIQAGIHLDTGEVFCNFQSIDLNTDLPPPANAGFLPPEDGTGRGQGHVTFFIHPKAGLPNGAEIRNVALVDFDHYETIATDQVAPHDPSQGVDPTKQALVTIDSGAPTSSVAALPAESGHAFWVRWSGQDDPGGSGIASYDVFVSTNAGPFGMWLGWTNGLTAPFIGELGHTYAFYSIARDAVGNEEAAPLSADAQTTVITNAPLLSLVADQSANVGASLIISNAIFGLPAGSFLWSLGPSAAFGAHINPTNGVLQWTPACSQGSTTNQITVWVTDRTRPNISDAVTITIAVRECVAPQLGRLVLATGETGSLPVDLISSVPLTNLVTLVSMPINRFINPDVEAVATQLCTTTIQATNGFPLPGGDGQSQAGRELNLLTLTTCNDQLLTGTQQVAWLVLTAATNQHSAFVPVEIGPSIGMEPDGTLATNYLTQAGRVVIVGEEPLLEAVLASNHRPALILYGQPGPDYVIEGKPRSDASLPWQVVWQGTQTNLFQQIQPIGGTNQMMFFRAARIEGSSVNRIGGVTHLADGRLQFQFTGVTGQAYVIEASTNLLNWQPLATNTAPITYSTPLRPVPPNRFFRLKVVP